VFHDESFEEIERVMPSVGRSICAQEELSWCSGKEGEWRVWGKRLLVFCICPSSWKL